MKVEQTVWQKNSLEMVQSPYLKQHAKNPVWWKTWSPETFALAKSLNRPIFISIGYSTCHWCHVMEHESFQDQAVAEALNKWFVAIKVDREERPDVDAHYMEAVQAMTGHGGWPLTAITTPDGVPFFTGTYLPKENLLHLLGRVQESWNEEPDRILQSAQDVWEHLRQEVQIFGSTQLSPDLSAMAAGSWERELDSRFGGKVGAPKFPHPFQDRWLLAYAQSHKVELVDRLADSCLKMSRGGIYDHVGGGFHRYSVDEEWQVPHFEKMLYDQAAHARVFLELFHVTNQQDFRYIAEDTLNYVLRERTQPGGGYFAAEDADSEGEEGKFYLWTEKEIRSVLTSSEYDELTSNLQMVPYESGHILTWKRQAPRLPSATLKTTLQKLRVFREGRERPMSDKKVITAWNGMMIATLAFAGRVLTNKIYLAAAEQTAEFLLRVHLQNGELVRYSLGKTQEKGQLEDYANLVDGLLELEQSTGTGRWLKAAIEIQEIQELLFWDDFAGGYNDHLADAHLPRQMKTFIDNVTPAGNSLSAWNLYRLSKILPEQPRHMARYQALLARIPHFVTEHPGLFPLFFMGDTWERDFGKNAVCAGPDCKVPIFDFKEKNATRSSEH